MSATALEIPLTAEEVRTLFRISPRTFWVWQKNGKLPKPVRVGRRLLFNRREVLALLEGKPDAQNHT